MKIIKLENQKNDSFFKAECFLHIGEAKEDKNYVAFNLRMRPEIPQNIVSAYFIGWGMNFIAALPLQLLIVGPISRLKLQMWQRYFDSRI